MKKIPFLRKHNFIDFFILSLTILSFLISSFYQSLFLAICFSCYFIFWVIYHQLNRAISQKRKFSKKTANIICIILLIPNLIFGLNSILGLHTPPILPFIGQVLLIIICALIILATFMLLFTGTNTSTNTIYNKTYQTSLIVSFSVPFSIIIIYSLQFKNSSQRWGYISTAIFSLIAIFYIAIFLINLHLQRISIVSQIKNINSFIKKNKLNFTRILIVKSAFSLISTFSLFLASKSIFIFANAIYVTGMGFARFLAVQLHKKDIKKQRIYYRYIGIVIAITSIFYILYSLRYFNNTEEKVYPMNMALIIALYTFIELALNIKDIIKLRKSNVLQVKALSSISLASTFASFVLTQTAILSFAAPTQNNSYGDALGGIFFGSLSTIVGVLVIVDSLYNKKISNQ